MTPTEKYNLFKNFDFCVPVDPADRQIQKNAQKDRTKAISTSPKGNDGSPTPPITPEASEGGQTEHSAS